MKLTRLLLATAALMPAAAFAQDAPPAEDDGGIQDIVVTARKVSESLSDAPVAVSVVGADKIRELGLNSIDDFAKQSTGISFSQAFGRSTDRPVIRGQSNVLAGVQSGVETGAAYFIDGVYYQGDIQGFDPESIERVEVIKGPQSALYGRNTYAGAINYITKDPTESLTATGRARAAEYDEYEIAGSISGQIIDGLGFRAGGRYFTYGGQYTNQLTGRKVGDEETYSGYLTLTFEINDDIRQRSRVSYQHDIDGPLAIFLQGSAANNCFPGFRSPAFRAASPFLPLAPATLGVSNNANQYFCGTVQPQPGNVRLNTDPLPISAALGTRDGTAFDGVENEQVLLTNVIDWDIAGSGFVLSSLTGWRDNTNYFGTDSDHSEAFAYFAGTAASTLGTEPLFANTNKDRQNDFSQEVRLSSPVDRSIRGMIGGYYYFQNFKSTDITFASGKEGTAFGSDLSNYSTIENIAVFGLIEVKPFEGFSITGEVRYQEETKTLLDRASAASIFCAGEADIAAVAGAAPATCRAAGKFTGTDPRITINYTTPGGTLIYAVYAQGRKPGGFNGTAGVTATAQTGQDVINYLPERSKGGEIGVKFDAIDRTLRVALTGFYNELSNVQLTSAIPNPNGLGALTSIVTNSGDAETSGFELEIQAAPTRGLNANFGVSYVNAVFTRGCDADFFILNSGGLRPNFDTRNPTPAGLALCDISGKRLPLGSDWIVNGSLSYETDLGTSGFQLYGNTNFSLESSKFVQTDNFAETGDAFLLNARLGIKTENFTLSVFGRNLTNEQAVPLATRWFDLRYGGGTRGLPAPPGPGQPVTVPFDGRPAQVETGTPRGFFATLRKGRTFGVEGTFSF